MPRTATVKCPACGKVNAELHSAPATPCTRCTADLQPLVRIQLAAIELQTNLLQQLATNAPAQAQTTLKNLKALSATSTTHPAQQLLASHRQTQ